MPIMGDCNNLLATKAFARIVFCTRPCFQPASPHSWPVSPTSFDSNHSSAVRDYAFFFKVRQCIIQRSGCRHTPQKWVCNIWKDAWPQCRRRPTHMVEFKWENFTSLSICVSWSSAWERAFSMSRLICSPRRVLLTESHTVTPISNVCMYKNSYYIHLIFLFVLCFVSFSSLLLENDPNCTIIRLNFSSLSFKHKSLTHT